MEESITRAAGATHGQEMTPAQLQNIARDAGRVPRQRTTLYRMVDDAAAMAAAANVHPHSIRRQVGAKISTQTR